jgi:hypothetical protein
MIVYLMENELSSCVGLLIDECMQMSLIKLSEISHMSILKNE